MALLISSQASAIPIFLAILIGMITGFLATLLAMHLHSEYMDEVVDAGDRLVIWNRGGEESIELKDIREVESTSRVLAPSSPGFSLWQEHQVFTELIPLGIFRAGEIS